MGKVFAFGAASEQAARVDSLFLLILVVGGFFFLLTQGLLVYFAVKYRRRRPEQDDETPPITGHHLLEFFWILIPSLVVVAIFYYGWKVYADIHGPPEGQAVEVHVNGRQWLYEVKYADGRTEINEIHVPAGRPVKFILSSSDVIHGFYLPDFRVKMDMIPGRTTTLWVQPDRPGVYQIYCTVYCGDAHSRMLAKLVALDPQQYAEWEEHRREEAGEKEHEPLAERGERIVRAAGCLNCHVLEGAETIGPAFKGIFGKKVVLEDGRTVVADEEYLRESIVDPGAKIVKGRPNVMPTFKTTLSAGDVDAVVEYLKTLK